MNYAFQVSQPPEITCNLDCKVEILPNDDRMVRVEVTGSSRFVESCKVTQYGNQIKIDSRSSSSGGGTVIIGDVVMKNYGSGSGTFVSVGDHNGTTIITGSGNVVINGKRINLDSMEKSDTEPTPTVTIYAPTETSLDCSLSGIASLVSTAKLNDVYVQCKGDADVNLAAESLGVDISGSGRIKAVLKGGELNIGIAGSGRSTVIGEWSKANIQISGSGQSYTSGVCNGDYKASVSGSGCISHTGSIKGKTRKNVSGSGRIDI